MLTPLRFLIEDGRYSPLIWYKISRATEKQVTRDVHTQIFLEIYLRDLATKNLLLRALLRSI